MDSFATINQPITMFAYKGQSEEKQKQNKHTEHTHMAQNNAKQTNKQKQKPLDH